LEKEKGKEGEEKGEKGVVERKGCKERVEGFGRERFREKGRVSRGRRERR
jgi:hypothetical protein